MGPLQTAAGSIDLADGTGAYIATAGLIFTALAVTWGVRKVIGVLNKS
jgi:hypothetical protein